MKSFLVTALFFFSFISAELTHLEKGKNFYDQRAEKSIGLKANPNFIEQAINEFQKAINNPEDELDFH